MPARLTQLVSRLTRGDARLGEPTGEWEETGFLVVEEGQYVVPCRVPDHLGLFPAPPTDTGGDGELGGVEERQLARGQLPGFALSFLSVGVA